MKHMSQSVQASATASVIGDRHPVDFAGRAVVDQVEQAREGVAQIEAAPAAVTDVEDAAHLRLGPGAIGEIWGPATRPCDGSARPDCLPGSGHRQLSRLAPPDQG